MINTLEIDETNKMINIFQLDENEAIAIIKEGGVFICHPPKTLSECQNIYREIKEDGHTLVGLILSPKDMETYSINQPTLNDA